MYSFSETLKRMLNKIDNFIYKLENAQKNGVIDGEVIDEDIEAEGVLDYKYEIKLEHIDKKSYLLDLKNS